MGMSCNVCRRFTWKSGIKIAPLQRFLGLIPGISKDFPGISHAFSMVSHQFSMDFPWISSQIPVIGRGPRAAALGRWASRPGAARELGAAQLAGGRGDGGAARPAPEATCGGQAEES